MPFDLAQSKPLNLAEVGKVPAHHLAVSETFESVQGEGVRIGVPSLFVRLRYCDGTCSWCDAKYTWLQGGEGKVMRVGEVLTLVRQSRMPNVVVTGGEPLLQWEALTELLRPVLALHRSVEIETNGAHEPLGIQGVQYNVSPKLAHADSGLRYRQEVFDAFKREDAWYKFVVREAADVAEAAAFVERFGLPRNRVLFMPEGTSRDAIHERLEWLVPLVAREYPEGRVTTRMHVEVYGKALRGV